MNNILSVLTGAFIAVMITFNGELGSRTGNYLSSVIIHIVGLMVIIGILIITKSKLKIDKEVPIYMYSAGAIGVFTVLFNNITFSTLGVSLTIALGLFGQSMASIVIDHYGLLGMKVIKFNPNKLVGLVLIILGIIVMAIF
ncbi:DMT family transporter [Romboutsia timonensis]|uniref:DMT family transporter n=1 Tax=Romboutsia timonensis TaxID=1776391 RepID=UPI002A75347D|nr:DMT family transporter [Romboutsia timonensis]MCI6668915.1 DMT family transporter [Romboutsia timonensis]MDY3002417.1 DMT family transporter [Romboutsia timonensis]MDY3960580.1 DMT family transporter [Romboutsia timonensis]